MRVVRGDVRWIAGDQVEGLACQWREPVAQPEVDIAQGVVMGITPRQRQRRCTGIGGDHLRLRTFAGNGQRNRATAGAQVGSSTARRGVEAFQRQLDQ